MSASGLNLQTVVDIPKLTRILKCHRVTIYREIRAGRLRPLKIRNRTLFTPAEIERFIAANLQE